MFVGLCALAYFKTMLVFGCFFKPVFVGPCDRVWRAGECSSLGRRGRRSQSPLAPCWRPALRGGARLSCACISSSPRLALSWPLHLASRPSPCSGTSEAQHSARAGQSSTASCASPGTGPAPSCGPSRSRSRRAPHQTLRSRPGTRKSPSSRPLPRPPHRYPASPHLPPRLRPPRSPPHPLPPRNLHSHLRPRHSHCPP